MLGRGIGVEHSVVAEDVVADASDEPIDHGWYGRGDGERDAAEGFGPEFTPGIFDRLGHLMGAVGGGSFFAGGDEGFGIHSADFVGGVEEIGVD